MSEVEDNETADGEVEVMWREAADCGARVLPVVPRLGLFADGNRRSDYEAHLEPAIVGQLPALIGREPAPGRAEPR